MNKTLEHLQSQLQGDMYGGALDCALYSTDASFYRIPPLVVVVPRSEADVIATVQTKLPIVPRGGGTSVSGQAVGSGIVLDFSKYMHRILEVNVAQGWAWVEPGVVQDKLRTFLAPYGLYFAPETATSSRATLGGMAANNSAGPRSIIHGKAIDHILECRVVLSDGSVATFGPVSDQEIAEKAKGSSLEAQIYRKIPRLITAHSDEILARYPKILRRVSGYNLDALLPAFPNFSPLPDPDPRFNLTKLLVGSEGTLGIITALKVRLIPIPKATALGVVHFQELHEAIAAVNPILTLAPSAIELVDANILGPAARSQQFKDRIGFLQGEPGAVLLVEFQGDHAAVLKDYLTQLTTLMHQEKLSYATTTLFDPASQQAVWNLRKAGLGMLMSVRSERKPVAFVEDPAVPVEKLPEFVREFERIIASHGTTAGYYGHASVGCLHIRPALNMKAAADITHMKTMLEEISDLTLRFGGAMSGEHGDGLVRGWLNEKMFGPRLYAAFKTVKQTFDFENRLNPGKIVDAPMPDENLRFGATYQTIALQTTFDFSREQGFARAVEMCNGNGNCRKQEIGTMCPSYQGTLDEKHSTRGRANALRSVISGQVADINFSSPELHEVMDLCLSCKSCQTECPSSVNMAKLKAEFLSHYHQVHGTPLRDRVVGHIALVNQLGSAFAPLSNYLMQGILGKLGKKILGFAPQRQLPLFVQQTFSQWFKSHTPKTPATRGKIVLFHDTYMQYNDPVIGHAATKILETLGYEIILPQRTCCGRPMISKGLLNEAQVHAQTNIKALLPYARAGIPIVGCEPSCILTLRDEYIDLVPGTDAKEVAAQTFTMDEFLYQLLQKDELNLNFQTTSTPALFHGHCHQKALVGTTPSLALLKLVHPTQEINSGCCGMAGSFGYEQEHYDLSITIGSQRLFPAITQAASDTCLVANGISCRQQIHHGTERQARHLVEILAAALLP